ncbi:d-tagatose-1 6-bisphosphate aldolase subunit gaty [Phtheirospermum japonicum]|uniref:D-tagatose-1 6-bisphosphate aldolase subunit gaty n=1 Tax=Phtheirospermum japonicum TaxID=374723 RepID=A0A830BUU1_9LAMI|nr:d-tagatose-1 6-bisphosphate aldolase subunit gaty [Phtheirospermum japonicum]
MLGYFFIGIGLPGNDALSDLSFLQNETDPSEDLSPSLTKTGASNPIPCLTMVPIDRISSSLVESVLSFLSVIIAAESSPCSSYAVAKSSFSSLSVVNLQVYESLTGVKVEGKAHALNKESVLGSLPPEWPTDPIEDIINLTQKISKTLVVLDDDPTGTQTVHGIYVLTEWTIESLVELFSQKPKCFFILTNSRSAGALITEICSNLSAAAKIVGNTDYTVVLRGDSTLRDAAISVIGEVDAWIICPFFLQGGRYTIGDVHYVADSDRIIPAGETEFAKDASFGYKSSNLREWVEEKTGGRIPASSVASISIQLLRKGGPRAVCERLCSLEKGSTCIVNAASERDMAVFAAGMIQAELKGKTFLCRTAASFVSTRVGIIPKAPLLPTDLALSTERAGGLIVVGSYVPKTTKQVEELLLQRGHDLKLIEVSVDRIAMRSIEEREEEINQTAEIADVYLRSGKDTLVLTSRQLVDNYKTALYPCKGNVGDSKAVAEVVKHWTRPSRLSTKELLLNAENGGYAVGAFNVYNLEGIEAVVAAAEEQRSPAILQIHPSALKQGGVPLVACCISAAEQACGFDSIMVDGSHLSFKENISHTKYISVLAHAKQLMVEAELGRLSGTEDDLTVEDYEARLTDVNQADEFIDATGIDALAVCIGNVHGKYPESGPNLRLDLLKDLYDLCSRKEVHLVLHGASGLEKDIIEECVKRGVRKFNVNTEVRNAYMASLKSSSIQKDLIHVMASAKEAMKAVIAEKMHLFGSAGKA